MAGGVCPRAASASLANSPGGFPYGSLPGAILLSFFAAEPSLPALPFPRHSWGRPSLLRAEGE